MADRQQDPRVQQKLVNRVLSDPDLFPDEFKSWIPRYVNDSLLFKVNQFQLPSVENTRYVGGSDQPAFLNSWVNYGGGYETAGFYKESWLRVFLTGEVKSGGSGTTIFTLPAGYRPKNREQFAVVTDTGIGAVDVTGTGDVIHISGGTGSVNLSGISFRAFQ